MANTETKLFIHYTFILDTDYENDKLLPIIITLKIFLLH